MTKWLVAKGTHDVLESELLDPRSKRSDPSRLTQVVAHPELLLFRYLPNPDEKNVWKAEHLARIARLDFGKDTATKAFRELAARRSRFYRDLHAEVLSMRLTSEYTHGLSIPSVIENGFSFAKPWGIPHIPAETIKGDAKAWLVCCLTDGFADADSPPAEVMLQKTGCDVLFPGEAPRKDDQGNPLPDAQLTIFDAWPAYDRGGCRFRVSGTTPHQVGWYREKPEALPDGIDNPEPVPYLAVRRGTPYDIAFTLDTKAAPPFTADQQPTKSQQRTLKHFGIRWDSDIKTFFRSLLLSTAEFHGFGSGSNLGRGRLREDPRTQP